LVATLVRFLDIRNDGTRVTQDGFTTSTSGRGLPESRRSGAERLRIRLLEALDSRVGAQWIGTMTDETQLERSATLA